MRFEPAGGRLLIGRTGGATEVWRVRARTMG